MIAEIRDNIHIYLTHITDAEENFVWIDFSVTRPNRYIDPTQLGNWDGIFRKYNRLKKRFARPLLQHLEIVCKKHNLPLKIVDKREPWLYEIIDLEQITPDFLPGITLEDYQINAIKQACLNECGIIDVPTGGGKCLGKGTPVLMYDNTIKKVEDIIVGDLLMGDDLKPRTVLSLATGADNLYLVKQKVGINYVVNSEHILTLKRNGMIIDIALKEYLIMKSKHLYKGIKAKADVEPYNISVEAVGKGQYFGFEIDGNKRFLLGDYTITHNTEVISGICKAIKCPTVILANQTVIIDQIKQRLELRDVVDEVGLFYAGKKPDGQMVIVGSIQSLSPPTKYPEVPKRSAKDTEKSYQKKLDNWEQRIQAFKTRRKNAKILQQYVHDAEMIIVDECDTAVGDQWKALFRYHFHGRRRIGVTGTPFDKAKPVEAMVLKEHLGSVIAKESRDHLTELGRIIPCEYYMMGYGLDGSVSESTAYDVAYDEHIVNSVKFSNIVKNLCVKYCTDDDGALIIVDREALGLRLMDVLTTAGLKAEFIYGKTPKRQRDAALRAFERRELNVLIGGKIINRGLDLAGGCEMLIIASGGKLQSEFLQKLGRALRRNKRGKSRVIDFFFRCNKYLYQHSKARLGIVLEAGYPVKIVLPGGLLDGKELVRNRYRIPNRYLTKS